MATNMVHCSYQEIIDMHTESGHVTAVGIHTPTGSTPREMFSGFFDQFKKMKYLGASLTFVPVATLPADPSQVSYEAGEPGIDPRDLVNPIMFHGCHGDDLGGILNKLYGDNDEISSALDGIDYDGFGGGTQTPLALTLHRLYYKALTDKTWKKAHPQKGFKKSGLRPLVYSLAANRQLGYGMDPFNAGDMNIGSNGVVQVIGGDPTSNYPVQPAANTTSAQGIQFMTPRLTSLGWIDTKSVLTSTVLLRQPGTGDATQKMMAAIADGATRQTNYAELPKIFMGVILLAPAYKTELYFRVIINHYFAFKGFRGVSFKPEVTGVPSYYDRNDDVFDINPTFPDLPSDFPGFGDDNGGDDNGGDDNGGDDENLPVITTNALTQFANGTKQTNLCYLGDTQLTLTAAWTPSTTCRTFIIYDDLWYWFNGSNKVIPVNQDFSQAVNYYAFDSSTKEIAEEASGTVACSAIAPEGINALLASGEFKLELS